MPPRPGSPPTRLSETLRLIGLSIRRGGDEQSIIGPDWVEVKVGPPSGARNLLTDGTSYVVAPVYLVAGLEDVDDVSQGLDVGRRVAVYHQEVGLLAGLQRADLVVDP